MVAASTQYFDVANNSLLNPASAMTIEGWVKFASTNNANYTLASKGNLGTVSGPFYFYVNPNADTMNLYISNGSSTTTSSVSWTPTISTWYHIAATTDGSGNVIFYVNGVKQGATQTGANSLNGADTSPFYIGAFSTTGVAGNAGNFDGQVSLVRFWSTNLSASTILNNKCNVYGGATSNMIGEWTLNNVLTDDSGNSFTLTNGNSTTFTTDTPAICSISTTKIVPLMTLMGVGV